MGCCYSLARSDSDADTPKPNKWQPLEKRSCTDIIPLVIFVLFFIGMIIIAAFSIASGAAARLIYGYDSYGNICNKMNKQLTDYPNSGKDLRDNKYIFFMDVTDPETAVEICVSSCPDKELKTMQDVYDFYKETGSQLCDYSVPPDEYLSGKYKNSKIGPCPTLPIAVSSPVFRRCVPDYVPDFIFNLVKFVNNVDTLSRVIGDIYACRYAIIGMCFMAVLVSFVVVLLIRYLSSIVVYIINILVALASLAATGLMWWTYASTQHELSLKPPNITFIGEIENSESFLWYSIATTVLTLILLLLIFVMRKRVALAVDLFYEAGRCMTAIPLVLLQPVWTFIVLVLFWIGWVAVFGFLATSGEMVIENKHYGWVKYEKTAAVRYMWWYHVIGVIWISEFILACQQMTIAGAVAQWYFTRDKKKLGSPILSSVNRLVTNHMGSCAFGSFVIILVKIPRCILMYIHRQIKDSDNIIAKFMVKCCICCLWVLEKCLRYLNYNAYSLVAINGTNFCSSACDAVATLVSNALRVIAINSLGLFVLFLGKLMVMAIVAGVGGVLVMRWYPDVYYIAAPVGVIALLSYLTAHCFLSIYDMTIDTLLLCFCEDSRVNNGMPGKEYFMSKSLMAYVKDSSKHIDKLEGKKKKTVDSPDEAEAMNV